MPIIRPLLIYAAVLGVVFAAALGIGYVYEHEPERDLIEVVIDRSAPPAGDGEFISGTVAGIEGDTAFVGTDRGTLEIALNDVTIEELHALEDPSDAPEGADVNLGGERTATERVISGVVLIAPSATP